MSQKCDAIRQKDTKATMRNDVEQNFEQSRELESAAACPV